MEPTSDSTNTISVIDSDMPSEGPGMRRTVTTLVMVLSVGFAAYMLAGRSSPRDATNLVGLVGSVAIEPAPLLETSSAGEIEDALHSELGYHLLVPGIVGARIVGVGMWDAGRDLKIPVVSYDDPLGDIRTVLILNYVILDRISDAVFIDRSIRLELELEQDKSYAVVSASDNREVVLWRLGDDIFVAIAENGAGRLIPRISQPGSGAQG